MEGERTVRGVRDSLVMVQMRPRWAGEETSVWNAVCSSCEALKACQLIEEDGGKEDKPDIPDCILIALRKQLRHVGLRCFVVVWA